jgi:hypothetical protein
LRGAGALKPLMRSVRQLMTESLDQIADGYRRFCFEGDDDDTALLAFLTVGEYAKSDPESCWLVISKLIEGAPTANQLGTLGAGPLEDLLRAHGEHFIDRLREAALENPAWLLAVSAIYAHSLPEAVRAKLEEVRELRRRPPGAA